MLLIMYHNYIFLFFLDDESKLKEYLDSFEKTQLTLPQLKQLRDQEVIQNDEQVQNAVDEDDGATIRKSKRKRFDNNDPDFNYDTVKEKSVKDQQVEAASSLKDSHQNNKAKESKDKSMQLLDAINERREKAR